MSTTDNNQVRIGNDQLSLWVTIVIASVFSLAGCIQFARQGALQVDPMATLFAVLQWLPVCGLMVMLLSGGVMFSKLSMIVTVPRKPRGSRSLRFASVMAPLAIGFGLNFIFNSPVRSVVMLFGLPIGFVLVGGGAYLYWEGVRARFDSAR